jgi:hypothetical protein
MGTGYTRNDTVNNIADGNVINASDLDGEFDAVQAAFDAATGHTHDGSTAEGAPITVTGPAQEYVSTNTNFRPKTNNTYDLGSSSLQWKDLYVDGTANLDAVDIDGGAIDGTTVGATSASTGAFTTLTASSTATLNTLSSSGATITGGSINGTTVGATTASTGAFTTLTSSGTTTLNGTTIPASVTLVSTEATQTLTNKTLTSPVIGTIVNTGTLTLPTTTDTLVGRATTDTLTNKTISGSNNTLSNIANASLTNSSITFGSAAQALGSTVSALNGVTIGATTASTGAFTTLSASTSLTTPLVTNAGTLALSATGANVVTASTNGVERLRIDSAGSVGIGTNDPASILNVVGEQAIIAGGVGTGNLGIQIKGAAVTAIPAAQVQGYIATGQSDIGTAGDLLIAPRTNTTASVRFITGTTPAERLRITSAGNVGIGTSAPAERLEVVSSSTGAIRFLQSSASIATHMGASATSGFIVTKTNHPLVIGTNDTERMRIDSAGNVGIGTTPQQKLHLHDGGTGQVVFAITNADTGSGNNDGLHLGLDANENALFFNKENTAAIFATNNTERMRITSAGNVGIGTTPSAWWSGVKALQVQGASLLSSGITSSSTANAFLNSTPEWRYIANGEATHYEQTQGSHRWFTAASGTAGNAVSFSERMRITSAGNVGIGTSSPATNLHVASAGTNATLKLSNSTSGSGSSDGYDLIMDGNDAYVWNRENGPLLFGTNNTERARIDASGNLLIGTTTTGTTNAYFEVVANARSRLNLGSNTTTSVSVARFNNPNGTVGQINTSDSATTYATSSDYRLKEDVQPMVGTVDRLMALKPVNFAWKVDGSRVDGFLAHEAQEVVPQAVTGEKDGEEMQAIDHSKLVPLLTAALQEALKRIEALEARITALEA